MRPPKILAFILKPLLDSKYEYSVDYSKQELIERIQYSLNHSGYGSKTNLTGSFRTENTFKASPRVIYARNMDVAYIKGEIIETEGHTSLKVKIYPDGAMSLMIVASIIAFPALIVAAIYTKDFVPAVVSAFPYIFTSAFATAAKNDLKESIEITLYKMWAK